MRCVISFKENMFYSATIKYTVFDCLDEKTVKINIVTDEVYNHSCELKKNIKKQKSLTCLAMDLLSTLLYTLRTLATVN